MKVTYLGTTTLMFDDGKDQLLFDCHVTRPSLLGFILKALDSVSEVVERVISDFKIERLRGIFVSHTHFDHVLDAPAFIQRTGCNLYGSLSAMNYARGNGVKEEKLFCYDENKEYQIGDFRVKIIPSLHSKPAWYNNDLGQVIEKPFKLPAGKKYFKEGGSYDFLINHQDKTYLIRPSYACIKGQLDGIEADVLFLGIAGIEKDEFSHRDLFFKETIGKVKPKLVIPVHWDGFFYPLYSAVRGYPFFVEDSGSAMALLADYCLKYKTDCVVQLPRSTFEIE